ncbi:MAG TPA: signal peptidase I [Verrucomicrobiae bacterium]|jgi:signal peptidase I|nr:signal peptidase I [Verrucomicrobiae bacterium]
MSVSEQLTSPTWPPLAVNGQPFETSWSWILQQCRFLVIIISLGTLSYWLISHFIIQAVEVEGPSMSPTLSDSGHYWLNRVCYLVSQPRPADIVVVRDPSDNGLDVKRIIAGPEQWLSIRGGKVYVNSQLLSEPYLMPKTPTYAENDSGNELIILGKNQYFVMGDNRGNSLDSRDFGTVPRRNILGKVEL